MSFYNADHHYFGVGQRHARRVTADAQSAPSMAREAARLRATDPFPVDTPLCERPVSHGQSAVVAPLTFHKPDAG